MTRILVVEDDPSIRMGLEDTLTAKGYEVEVVGRGAEGAERAASGRFDLVVLDVMLPDIDGLQVCATLRRRGDATPILLLTARDAIDDRVAGLDAGADDYLVKPFAFAELGARLRALARRPPAALDTVLTHGPLTLDPATRRVTRDGVEIQLSKKEYQILEYMMRRPRMVHTRTMIANHVWDYDFPNVTNVIDVHIRQLRNKLGDPYPSRLIQTVRGVGYRLGDDT